MKRLAKLGICACIFLLLSGCINYRTNTKAPILPDNAIPNLNVMLPVAFKNVSSQSADILIGSWGGWRVYADFYEYTESSISTAKNILERQNIKVNNSADKILELSIYDAKSERGMWAFQVTTTLRVKTANGLKKEYVGVQKHGSGYGTTSAIEKTLAKCVTQMLNDKDIIRYLESSPADAVDNFDDGEYEYFSPHIENIPKDAVDNFDDGEHEYFSPQDPKN